ncbi:MAG: sulfotransferase [Wenzhouxiangella sp.]|jgi:tetratricopeptide (TPR) repeat protein|nr:sulfotransferase [Wenzhouxiangella sp.]
MSKQTTSSFDDTLAQAERLLRHQQIPQAESLLNDCLQTRPNHHQALFYKAVCRRADGDHSQALSHLKKALEGKPDYGRAWQEIGHNHRDQGQKSPAIEAYRRACELNPGLLASWRELAQLLAETGHPQDAASARANHDRLAKLPKVLQSVTSMMHEGRLYKAEQACRQYLKAHPKDTEGMRLLAAIGAELNVLDDAEFLLESALEFEPKFDLARLDYVKVLHKRQKFQKAFDQAVELRRRLPNNLAAEMVYANQCAAIGRYQDALAVLDPLVDISPHPENVHMQRGHAFKTIGEQDQAIGAYQAAAAQRPEFGDAWWSLANLKTYRFSDDDLDRMAQALNSDQATVVDRYHLHFALGKAIEDRNDFEHAFDHYAQGNALKKAQVRYSADRMHADFERQKAFFTPERVASFEGQGDPAPDPIFIVGLPRAGSTLIEQILASHSQIDGTLELPNILATVHRLNGRQLVNDTPKYPQVLAEYTPEAIRAMGSQYIEDTRIHRQGAPLFTDKMPNNFRHIGLIKTMLPNARIIDARRHPMACCFSGFKQLFAEGQEFSYGLDDIGRYWADYADLMDHWHAVYPGEILQVDYEAVVEDLDAQVKRMLTFLGLEFEPQCVEFHQTQRSVRTASAEQVRQPIYQAGVAQWRHFEPWLGPLKATLGEHAD